jgi:hypothetical protein
VPLPLPADQPPRRVHGGGASPLQWECFHRLYQTFLEDRGTFSDRQHEVLEKNGVISRKIVQFNSSIELHNF